MKIIPNSKNSLETILQPMERGQITLPKAIREAAGITPDTWLWVRYLPSGKIEVEVAENKQSPKPDLVSALLKLRKSKKPLWTEEDDKRYAEYRQKSLQRTLDLKKIW